MNQRNNIPMPQEYSKIKSDTDIFNSYLRDLDKISNKADPKYNSIWDNINKLNTPGIKISDLSIDYKNNIIILSGTAMNRENLNVFRSKLDNSSYFYKNNFSLKDIAKKENIMFNANLKTK